MIDKWWIGKDLEGNFCGLIKALSQYLPGKSEGNHNLSQDSLCPIQDWNLAPPTYKPIALSLCLIAYWNNILFACISLASVTCFEGFVIHNQMTRSIVSYRIDMCTVGDDSTCDSAQNEMCRTELGVSSCHCRPGYSRRKHREPCRSKSHVLHVLVFLLGQCVPLRTV
jgi:hypothetical protein